MTLTILFPVLQQPLIPPPIFILSPSSTGHHVIFRSFFARLDAHLEHQCLIDAVFGIGAWIDSEFDQSVTPRSGFEEIATILPSELDCPFRDGNVVDKRPPGPDRSYLELFPEFFYCALHSRLQSFDRGKIRWWTGRDDGRVVPDDMCDLLSWSLRICHLMRP